MPKDLTISRGLSCQYQMMRVFSHHSTVASFKEDQKSNQFISTLSSAIFTKSLTDQTSPCEAGVDIKRPVLSWSIINMPCQINLLSCSAGNKKCLNYLPGQAITNRFRWTSHSHDFLVCLGWEWRITSIIPCFIKRKSDKRWMSA